MINIFIYLSLTFLSLFPKDNPLLHYRIPDSRASLFSIHISPGGRWYNQDSRRYEIMGGELRPLYEILLSGERLSLEAWLSSPFKGDFSNIDYRTDDEEGFVLIKGNSVMIRPSHASSIDWYPINIPYGFGADLYTELHYQKENYKPTDQDFIPEELKIPENESYKRVIFSFLVGPTLGKVREAKTVVLALRIGEILKENGFLKHELSDGDVQELAKLLSQDDVFDLKWDRPYKYFYQVLESLLVKREIIKEWLPAFVWFRLKDEIDYSAFSSSSYHEDNQPGIGLGSRPVGIKLTVRGGLTYIKDHKYKYFPDSIYDYRYTKKIPNLKFSLISGYPVNTRLQFSQSAYWNVSKETNNVFHSFNASIDFSYRLLDHLLASVYYVGRFQEKNYIDNFYALYDYSNNNLAFRFKYYLENNLILWASTEFSIGRYRLNSPTDSWKKVAGLFYNLSFEYRLK